MTALVPLLLTGVRHHPPGRTDKNLCRCFGAPARRVFPDHLSTSYLHHGYRGQQVIPVTVVIPWLYRGYPGYRGANNFLFTGAVPYRYAVCIQ